MASTRTWSTHLTLTLTLTTSTDEPNPNPNPNPNPDLNPNPNPDLNLNPNPSPNPNQDGFNTDLVDSPRANSPRYSFRPKLPNYQTATASPAISARSPGPGSYNQDGAFGTQARSGVRS